MLYYEFDIRKGWGALSERIKSIREALKLSQREFGERLGVSRDVISNMEYGRVQPKALFLCHVCQVYHVNAHWLETGEGAMFEEALEAAGEYEEALRLFQSLRPEFQDYALELLKGLSALQEKV